MSKIDPVGRRASSLAGRSREYAVLDAFLAEVRAGNSRALVLRGEPGIGKTALLDHAAASAQGLVVVRAVGVESEMELPFAALHQLCGKMVDRLDHLPEPQANALGVAFGVRAGDSPDRFLVGLAVLSLMSDVAGDAPLLCVVDDTQWLDRASAQTLAFVARRIGTESIGLVFGTHDHDAASELVGLPEMIIKGISDADARDLLTSAIPGRLDERVRDRIIAEARGNPLAIIELPRAVALGDLAGGFGLPTAVSVSGRITDSFIRRFARLPAPTQLLLILAAAEPLGDPALLWHAARELGIGLDDATPAEDDGLLQLGDRVTFRHPLVRSAIYGTADVGDRERVHRALANAASDPDRRAWHRAQAASGPDEHVADELERSAGRALDRGGLPAAAAFLERAVELSPDATNRARRALAAASVKHRAGAPDAALELLTVAELGPLDDLQSAELERLRAQIVLAVRRGSDAPKLLLDAAKRLEPLDASLARETYLEAFIAAIFVGRLRRGCGVHDVAEAARAAPAPAQPPRAIDLLLDGLVTRFTQGYAASVVPLRRALDAFCEEGGKREDDLRWFGVACRVAPDLWDDETWHQLASRQIQLARDAGALTVLGIAATYRAGVHVHAGEFAAAAALNEEADSITRAAGIAPLMYTSLVLAAWSGDEARTAELINRSVRDATERGEGRAIAIAAYAAAVLENGFGRAPAALTAAQQACESDDLGLFAWALIELVEAGARSGATEIAATALDQLSERTHASGTDWALGIEARSRALLSEGAAAEDLYREAIERLGRCRIVVHRARAHLVYGEWLRRERRRADAREHLRAAYAMFISMGAQGFAERAARELRATGEQVRLRNVEAANQLTGQEEQIARLASVGTPNAKIAAQLFISPRTVEYHLHKVFTKLDITSRTQLAQALSEN